MSGEPLVEARGVSVAYRMAHDRAGTIKEYSFQLLRRQVTTESFVAAHEVSFTVGRGETLALVGPNGSGKTTLMKVIARVLPPTGGRVIVRGHVAPMIELGAGFNTEVSGFDNIVLYGTLLGRDPGRMRERAGAIADWAGLSDFLDVPVRAYSSGMLARLGFAIATDTEPDVLVVDEVLAVGDEAFQGKSFDRIAALMSGGTAVLLVSHQLDQVERLADRVLWLDKGRVRALGDPGDVISAYRASVTG